MPASAAERGVRSAPRAIPGSTAPARTPVTAHRLRRGLVSNRPSRGSVAEQVPTQTQALLRGRPSLSLETIDEATQALPTAGAPLSTGRHLRHHALSPALHPSTPEGESPWASRSRASSTSTSRTRSPDWEPYTQPIAPEGAPNVLYVVLDDVGFSAMEPYGGLIETPNIKRIAERGLTYTNFHTTALCSPTRSCLLTGRNHTTNGMACITEATSGLPERERPHPVRVREHRRGARRARLEHLHRRQVAPVRRGRDEPRLVEAPVAARPRLRALLRLPRRRDEPVVSRPRLRQPSGRAAELARGGLPPHGRPHRQGDRVHPGREGDRAGQAVLPLLLPRRRARAAPRAEGVGRQVQGQVRHGLRGLPRARVRAPEAAGHHRPRAPSCRRSTRTRTTTSHDGKPWSRARPRAARGTRSPTTRSGCSARMAEVYAGFLSHADHELGRLLDYLEESGQLDNTIIVLVSDNGASGEGGPNGSVNENKFFNGIPDTIEENLKHLDELGSPTTYNHYPTGWAWAFNTPFKLWKRYANYEGGTADPLIVSWPQGIAAGGEIRRQYTHAVDIVPTLLRVPRRRAARRRQRLHAEADRGRQLRRDASTTPTRRRGKQTQFYSMLGTRAIWHKGWKAATAVPAAPDVVGRLPPAALGAVRHRRPTRASATTSPREHPEKLQELIALWWAEAGKYQALPLESRGALEILGTERPQLVEAAQPLRLLPRRRRGARVGRPEHPQPLLHDRRRGGDRDAGGRRRALLAGLALRRPRALRQGRQAQVRLQLSSASTSRSSSPTRRSRPATSSCRPSFEREGDDDADRRARSRLHIRDQAGRRGDDHDPARQVRARRRRPRRRPLRRRAGHRRLRRASARGRSSAARSSGSSIDVSGEPFVDLAAGGARGVRPPVSTI